MLMNTHCTAEERQFFRIFTLLIMAQGYALLAQFRTERTRNLSAHPGYE